MLSEVFSLANYSYNPHAIPFLISGTLIIAQSVFVFIQNPRAVVNFSFAGIALSCGIWLTGVGIIYLCQDREVAYWWSRYYDWFGIVYICPFVYLFSTVFGRTPSKRMTQFAYLNLAAATLLYLYIAISGDFITGVWEYPWGFFPRGHLVGEAIYVTWFYVLMTLSFINFVVDYRRAKSQAKKKQIKIVIVAHIFGFSGSLDYITNFGIPWYTCGSVMLFLYASMFAWAIVNYKLMDIETVIHKTIVWLASFLVMIIPLVSGYLYLYPLIEDKVAWQVTYGVGGLVVYLIYLRTVQPYIDHFFQRRKADLEETSRQFGEDLVHLEGIEVLAQRIEETLANTLYPQRIDIFIYNSKNKDYYIYNRDKSSAKVKKLAHTNAFLQWLRVTNRIISGKYVDTDPELEDIKEVANTYFEDTHTSVVIPLVLGERLLGVVNLDKKANLKRYNAVDFSFLKILKNQAAVAISNSLIYQDIEEQVKERTAELVETQKQLVQAEKLATMGTLSGGVAHEINNPLTAILTNVQMMLAFADDEDEKVDKESLELIEEATQRCRTIVQKLMTYAKKPVEEGKVSVVDLKEVLDKTVAFISYQLKQDNIELVVEAKEGTYPVMANTNEMEQVLTNMILNARDATKEVKKSGQIYVTLVREDQKIKVEIKDEGVGMSEEVKKRIFDPFFTTKDVGAGLGLGLSICQSIVAKFDGVINVESEEGKGAVFTLEFLENRED